MITYIIYTTVIVMFVALYHYEKIKSLTINIAILFLKAFNDKGVIRDVSIGLFTSGVLTTIGSSSLYGFIGYGVLTLVALFGIINSNNR